MDGRTLMEIMQSPNFSMWGPAEQAFNTTQDKAKADLATTLGMEQRNAAMHPLDMQNKQAVTRLNNSTADINEYGIATRLPKDKALAQNMQKFFKESDDMTQEQTRMKVQRMMQIAQMAKTNKGALPPGFQLSPEEMQQYAPENLDKLIQYGQTFFANDPKEIAARQRATEAERLAKVRSDGQIAVKTTTGAGGAGGGKADPTMKMNWEQAQQYWERMAAAEKDEEKKKEYQAAADRYELMVLRRDRYKAQAGKIGSVDPVRSAEEGSPVARPDTPLIPTARGGNTWTPPNGWK